MTNTFTQIYIQIVFSVKNRQSLISQNKKEDLHKYIAGVVQNKKCKLLAINSMSDHIHLFVGFHPTICISNLVKDIKISSDGKIREQKWIKSKFGLQDGFGAFSYSKSQVDSVCKYIMNLEEHHKKVTFKEVYVNFLEIFEIDYKSEYVFDIK
ncbi:MAG: IS200/IS605 family transposase [Ignavibacteriae bacterium]|nr:IS200/IS605 family transposase [Ignavibacteriota bacterium]